jgi:hypothetical protein
MTNDIYDRDILAVDITPPHWLDTPSPPILVCLKEPANIENIKYKYFSHFYCILCLINIQAILAYVKMK